MVKVSKATVYPDGWVKPEGWSDLGYTDDNLAIEWGDPIEGFDSQKPVCKEACEHAIAVGMPEYSGMQSKPNGCGNCDHYLAPEEPAMEVKPVEIKFVEPADTSYLKFETVTIKGLPKEWPLPSLKWVPFEDNDDLPGMWEQSDLSGGESDNYVEHTEAPLDDPTVQVVRIERLLKGGGFGCAGKHPGSGKPGCPKALHHHHDLFCPLPTQVEWERAGKTGPVPDPFMWAYSRL